jgi:hypothetical protein
MMPSAGRIAAWVLAFQLAWNWKKLVPLFAQGAMPDTDDYVRLQQVRDWLGGQGWYDLVQHRMDPPLGADIHWSRLVDLPIAALVRLFGLFAPPPTAEAMAALVWPTMLLVATALVIVRICRALGDDLNPMLAVLFTVTCVTALTEFMPGRIDHHSVQILLFSLILLGLVSAGSAWGKILAGAAMAASISVGLDSLPLIGLLLGWIGFEWALGRDDGLGLRRTALGLAAALPLFLANIPPQRWLLVQCDANSIVYLSALGGVAAAFGALAVATPWLPSGGGVKPVAARFGVAAALALSLAAALHALFPACAAGPFALIDPVLATRWLPSVNEAMGLFARLDKFPEVWLSGVAYCVALLLAGAMVAFARGRASPGLVPAYAALVLSIAAAVLQYRALRIGIFASIPLCVAFVATTRAWLARRQFAHGRTSSVVLAAVVIALMSPVWWVAGVVIFPPAVSRVVAEGAASDSAPDWKKREFGPLCNERRQYEALARLEPGLVMADINSGPVALAMAPHPVVGGPYHRNARAILAMLDFFGSEPEIARRIAAERAVRYVFYCDPGDLAAADIASSKALAALILRGEEPAWLERLSPPGERFHLFRLR